MMLRNVLQTSGVNLIILLINIITGVLLARLLGPTLRGELVAVQTAASILSGLALLGLPEAVVYWIGREPQLSKQTIATTLCLFIPITIVTWLVGYLLIPFILQAQSAQVIRDAQIYMLSVVNITFGSIYVWGFQGLQDFKYWNLLRLFSPTIWLLAIVSGYAAGILSTTYLILFMLVFPIPFIPIFMRLLWRRLAGPRKPGIIRARQLFRFGLPITLSSLPQMLNLRLDSLILVALLSPELLGYYAVAVTWSGISSVLFSAIGSTIFPKVASQFDPVEHKRVIAITMRMSIFFSYCIILPQLFLTPFVIPLVFGDAYSPAVPAALVLVVAGGIVGLTTVWKNILNGLGHPEALFLAEILGLIATMVLLTLLLQRLLLMGAAITSLVSYSLTLIYLSITIRRYTRIQLRQVIFPTSNDLAAIRDQGLSMVQQFVLLGTK